MTLWNRFLLEKLTVALLVMKFSSSYEAGRYLQQPASSPYVKPGVSGAPFSIITEKLH
jgi:hypothetical protein